MKWVKNSFILLVVVIFLSGCVVQKPPVSIPTKERAVLTAEQIIALETEEIRKADEKAFSLAKEETKRLAKQPKVSNIFVEADIRMVLLDIATQTKINIIPDESVEGTVSVELKNVPLETALKMVLFPGNYSYQRVKEGNYYIVGTAIPESPSFESLSLTKVLKTNTSAEEVINRLSEYFKPFIMGRTGNTITISGPPAVVQRIERDVRKVDKAKRQIEVGVSFVIIQWEKASNLGIQWGDIDLAASSSLDFGTGLDLSNVSGVIAGLKNVVRLRDKRATVNTKVEPRLVVADGELGEIKLIEEHLFLIMSGGGAYYSYFTTKDIEVGMKLRVTPNIARDGEISLRIEPEISEITGEREFKIGGNGSQKLPIIARRSVNTNVKVANGETVVIGGLVMHTEQETNRGIPILSSIPLLNLVFNSKQKIEKDTELVILITPRIVK